MSHNQQQQQEYQEHILASLSQQHHQIRRDNTKLLRGFQRAPPSTLVGIDQHPSSVALHPVCETPEMLSEMFNFDHGPGPGPSTEILDYRRAVGGLGSDWYGSTRQVAPRDSIGDHQHQHGDTPTSHHHHQMPNINANSAAAMQLFLTNPPQRSPSPRQPPPQPASTSTLHMLLPRPSTMEPPGGGGGLHSNYWSSDSAHINNPGEMGGIVEGQGLSLSLSSSLQHLEAAKQAEQLRTMGDGDSHLMFFNILQQPVLNNLQGVGSTFGADPGPGPVSSSTGQHQVHLGFGSGATLGGVNGLRNSKYVKAAQELLEEFCSVGRDHLKKPKLVRQDSVNPNPSTSGPGGGSPSTSSKDRPQLSAGERVEHQRRKVKLLSMLDEVERRYNNYCEQMQNVVNSFDLALGYGAATPYTALAHKAMSRHFRCLKDAIQAQLRQSCEALGEKDPTSQTGLTKGETPRLKLLEQSLRQQRAFQHHQMGMTMEHEAWRPQRGLPDRSVNILRSWLFEHFLHPYPSDADKHTLARQTGLSRNQVSNWFINARVRLWKPMVEEMYQQEAKEAEQEDEELDQIEEDEDNVTTQQGQNPMPCSSSSASQPKRSTQSITLTPPPADRDPSFIPINRHHQPPPPRIVASASTTATAAAPPDNVSPTTMIRFGRAAGDVSLTLGLQHAGNTPDDSVSDFSVRDFDS